LLFSSVKDLFPKMVHNDGRDDTSVAVLPSDIGSVPWVIRR
jgi:hypothetical protein